MCSVFCVCATVEAIVPPACLAAHIGGGTLKSRSMHNEAVYMHHCQQGVLQLCLQDVIVQGGVTHNWCTSGAL